MTVMVTASRGCYNVSEFSAPYVFQRLRKLPICKHAVIAHYLESGDFVTINQDQAMDILQALGRNTISRSAPQSEVRVMVCPQTDVVPDDGVFDFRTVESVKDLLADFDNTTILMFPATDIGKRLLEMFVSYADVVKVQPVVVTGIPRADYSIEFESVTFPAPKISYHEAFEAGVTKTNDAIKTARSDKSEAGRSSRRETKLEDGGGVFTKFDVQSFGGRPISREDSDLGTDSE